MDLGVESLWQKPEQGATYLWLASHRLQAPWCPGGTSVVQVQVFPQGLAPPPRPCFARDKDEGCENQRRAGAEQASTLAAPSAGPLTSLGAGA